jgi:hypothetical protein
MIPTDPDNLKKMKELAERNIANGDWGDEITIYGLPGEIVPMSPEERESKNAVSDILSKRGNQKIPKKK